MIPKPNDKNLPNEASRLNLIRLPAVMQRTGLSRSSIYSYVGKQKFPKPIRLGERAVGWMEAEISAWIEQRAAMRGGE